jgi:hypothetical protein
LQVGVRQGEHRDIFVEGPAPGDDIFQGEAHVLCPADSRIVADMYPSLSALLLLDGVAKSPPYGVTAVFQDLDIHYVCLRP